MIDLPFDLSLGATLWLGLACFVAAFVRGYSGFGFAALVITPGSLVTDPLNLVPVVVIADIVLTAQQAPAVRHHVQWWRVGWLFLGCLAGVPLSVWALAAMGADAARVVIAVYVLIMCGLLMSGWTIRRANGRAAHVGTGFISGLANGAAVGGLPVAVFFAAQSMSAAAFRATNIAYFTLLDLWTLPLMAHAGLIGRDTLIATAMGLPLMILGVWAGGRRFLSTAPENFRRFAISLLAVLAVLAIGRSLV